MCNNAHIDQGHGVGLPAEIAILEFLKTQQLQDIRPVYITLNSCIRIFIGYLKFHSILSGNGCVLKYLDLQMQLSTL